MNKAAYSAFSKMANVIGISAPILNMHFGSHVIDLPALFEVIDGEVPPELVVQTVKPRIIVGKDWLCNNLSNEEYAAIFALRLLK